MRSRFDKNTPSQPRGGKEIKTKNNVLERAHFTTRRKHNSCCAARKGSRSDALSAAVASDRASSYSSRLSATTDASQPKERSRTQLDSEKTYRYSLASSAYFSLYSIREALMVSCYYERVVLGKVDAMC